MDTVLELSVHQRLVAIIMALALFAFVTELVRRRRLGEQYSWVWMLASAAVVLLVAVPDALKAITWLVGAVEPSTAVFLLGIMFLIVANLFLCSQLTRATAQIKRLAQHVALLSATEGGARPDAATPDDSGQPPS
jgi:hypothetical protein